MAADYFKITKCCKKIMNYLKKINRRLENDLESMKKQGRYRLQVAPGAKFLEKAFRRMDRPSDGDA